MDAEILEKLNEISLLLFNPDEPVNSILEYMEWLETIASWLSFHVGVWVPGIIIVCLFWWFIHQFMTRFY